MIRSTARTRPGPRWAAFALGVLGAIAAAPSRGTAQPASVQAQSLFDDGRRLLKAGKIAEACSSFEASQKLDPAVTTLLNLADCREQNQQLATAWGVFVDANRLARTTGNAKLATVATSHARKLEPRLSRLTIAVAPDRQIAGLEGAARRGSGDRGELEPRAAGRRRQLHDRGARAGPRAVVDRPDDQGRRRHPDDRDPQARRAQARCGRAAPGRAAAGHAAAGHAGHAVEGASPGRRARTRRSGLAAGRAPRGAAVGGEPRRRAARRVAGRGAGDDRSAGDRPVPGAAAGVRRRGGRARRCGARVSPVGQLALQEGPGRPEGGQPGAAGHALSRGQHAALHRGRPRHGRGRLRRRGGLFLPARPRRAAAVGRESRPW